MPSEFVPFAESTGFVAQIDRYVLDEACRQVAQWRRLWEQTEPLRDEPQDRVFAWRTRR